MKPKTNGTQKSSLLSLTLTFIVCLMPFDLKATELKLLQLKFLSTIELNENKASCCHRQSFQYSQDLVEKCDFKINSLMFQKFERGSDHEVYLVAAKSNDIYPMHGPVAAEVEETEFVLDEKNGAFTITVNCFGGTSWFSSLPTVDELQQMTGIKNLILLNYGQIKLSQLKPIGWKNLPIPTGPWCEGIDYFQVPKGLISKFSFTCKVGSLTALDKHEGQELKVLKVETFGNPLISKVKCVSVSPLQQLCEGEIDARNISSGSRHPVRVTARTQLKDLSAWKDETYEFDLLVRNNALRNDEY